MTTVMNLDAVSGIPIGVIESGDAHRVLLEANLAGNDAPYKHEHLGMYLLDMNGSLITSLRPLDADSNANQIDKSIGAHLPAGYSIEAGVITTSAREFQIPIAMVSQEELIKIVMNHPELLKWQAFVTELSYNPNYHSLRTMQDGESWKELCVQRNFLGVYDGPYKFSEGNGMRLFELEKLDDYLHRFPALFTNDLKETFEQRQTEMQGLARTIASSGSGRPDLEELIECSDMNGNFARVERRKDVHTPIMESYKAGQLQEYKHRHIGGLLVGAKGEIYVQIRSDDKAENAGKYDKLVGGHIPAGDSPLIAAYHEFIEEMRIPIGIYNEITWHNILSTTPQAIQCQAICKDPILVRDYQSFRERKDGNSFKEICDQYFVVGYYGGSFSFIDKEAAGIFQFADRDELKKQMDKDSSKFTDDLRYMVDLFWDDLVPLAQ